MGRMKKRTTERPAVPWEITESMFLADEEADGLVTYLRESERQAAPDEKYRALVDRLIVEILLFSGIRNSELCHLKIEDTEVGHGQSFLMIAESSNHSHIVHLPQALSQEIVNFVRGPRRAMANGDQPADENSQTLILNERGRPYDRTSLYRRVVRILTAAGLGDRASVQLLRHTYGYLAYKRSNGNLLFVQQQLGHAHPMVTAVYAQFVKFSYSDLAEAVGTPANPRDDNSLKDPQPLFDARKAKR